MIGLGNTETPVVLEMPPEFAGRAKSGAGQHSPLRHFSIFPIDYAVDFSSKQQHETADVKPGEQDNDCAEGAVCDRVIVEKVEVNAKT